MNKFLASMAVTLGLALGGTQVVLAKDAAAKAPLHANLSKDTKGASATSFGSADPAIYIVYHGHALKKGDKIGASRYIEDGGKTITKNAKVSESAPLVADRDNAEGFLNLVRPATGWPAGKWRVDLFVNGVEAGSYRFTVGK